MKFVALLATAMALASAHAYAQSSDYASPPNGDATGGYGYQDHPSHTPTFGSQATESDASPFAPNEPAVQPVSSEQSQDASQPDPRPATPEKTAPSEGK